jgi:hypothetical protein
VVADLDTTLGESDAWLPEVLPNGIVLYSVARPGVFTVVAQHPDGTRHDVMKTALQGRFCKPGFLFYWGFESRAVFAAPFDVDKALITGPAVPLTEEVDGNFAFDVDDHGTLVYVPTPGARSGGGIVWLADNGAATPAFEQRGPWAEPRISPDGRRIVVRKIQSECELWMFDIERGSLARIVQGGDNHDPVWSPDGQRVAYLRGGVPKEIRVTNVDGSRDVTTVVRGVVADRDRRYHRVRRWCVLCRHPVGRRTHQLGIRLDKELNDQRLAVSLGHLVRRLEDVAFLDLLLDLVFGEAAHSVTSRYSLRPEAPERWTRAREASSSQLGFTPCV